MNTQLIPFHLDSSHEGQKLPDWIYPEALLQCGNTHGYALYSYIADFTQCLYFPLDSRRWNLPSHLDFFDKRAPVYDAISDTERNRIKEHACMIHSFINNNISIPSRKDVSIFEDFNLCWMGMDLKVTQRFIPLDFDYQGNVRVGYFSVFPSFNTSFAELVVFQGDNMWTLNHSNSSFIERPIPSISESEKNLLLLARIGFPLKAISELQETSLNTLKKRRDRLFRKLGANCLQEALTIMDNYGLW